MNQRPLDTWGYDILMRDGPQRVNGKVWTDGAQDVPIGQWGFRSTRRVEGTPEIGSDVSAPWSIPVPVFPLGGERAAASGQRDRDPSRNFVSGNQRASELSVDWDAVDGAAFYLVVYQYQLGAGANVKLSTGSTRVPARLTETTITVNDSLTGSNRSVAFWSVVVHTIDSEGTVGGPSDVVEVDGVQPTTVTRLDAPSPTVVVGNQRIDISRYSVTNGLTYEIEWRRTTSTLWTTLSTTLTGGNTFLSGLVNGVGYIIRVRARNGNVVSAWWTSGTLTPMGLAVAPSDPRNLGEVDKSDTSIQWDWSGSRRTSAPGPASSTGGSSSAARRSGGDGHDLESEFTNRTGTATPRTAYTLEVRAETNAGNSAYVTDSANDGRGRDAHLEGLGHGAERSCPQRLLD